jgi:hypothetical protein
MINYIHLKYFNLCSMKKFRSFISNLRSKCLCALPTLRREVDFSSNDWVFPIRTQFCCHSWFFWFVKNAKTAQRGSRLISKSQAYIRRGFHLRFINRNYLTFNSGYDVCHGFDRYRKRRFNSIWWVVPCHSIRDGFSYQSQEAPINHNDFEIWKN